MVWLLNIMGWMWDIIVDEESVCKDWGKLSDEEKVRRLCNREVKPSHIKVLWNCMNRNQRIACCRHCKLPAEFIEERRNEMTSWERTLALQRSRLIED